MSFIESLILGIRLTSLCEWLGFITGVLYVVFAANKSMLCWLFAIVSSAIYIYLCFTAQLYIETILQVFYLAMAFYGWFSWKQSKETTNDLKKWTLTEHAINLFLSALVMLILGYFFDKYTNQQQPYLDAFTTCFSLAATYMVTKKIVENWIYWIVIDVVSMYLYWSRDYQLSAVLYFIFTIFI